MSKETPTFLSVTFRGCIVVYLGHQAWNAAIVELTIVKFLSLTVTSRLFHCRCKLLW